MARAGGGGSSLHLPPPLSAHNTLGVAQKSMVNLLYLSGLDCWAFLLLLTCMDVLSFACFARKRVSKSTSLHPADIGQW